MRTEPTLFEIVISSIGFIAVLLVIPFLPAIVEVLK